VRGFGGVDNDRKQPSAVRCNEDNRAWTSTRQVCCHH
jgi:hypothetical protein